MTHAPRTKTERIRLLNDNFRRSFLGGTVMITPGVEALAPDNRATLLHQVRQFEDFEAGGDPYGEHDFGSIKIDGTRFFWKVDLYEEPDVKDANGKPVVTRVLTIMLAAEY